MMTSDGEEKRQWRGRSRCGLKVGVFWGFKNARDTPFQPRGVVELMKTFSRNRREREISGSVKWQGPPFTCMVRSGCR